MDRTAKILPWDSREAGRVLSPVEVSARFLGQDPRSVGPRRHASAAGRAGRRPHRSRIVRRRSARTDRHGRRRAGLPRLTLLEEPAAAFYSWIANNFAQSRKLLFDGQVVLVCDVGGGTSDFSLIRVSRDGDKIDFTRTAVGKHLLLGGDNLDLTLAWLVETKLGEPLSIRQRSGLRRQCSAAKEMPALRSAPAKASKSPCSAAASSLIGGTLEDRNHARRSARAGARRLPALHARGEEPKEEKRSLFRELGLPYVSDPAITPPPNAFLEPTGQAPDAILFNGGFFIPEILRERVADVVAAGTGAVPRFSKTASSISPWPAARPIIPTCARPAAACWCAAACRALITSPSATRAIRRVPRAARRRRRRHRRNR